MATQAAEHRFDLSGGIACLDFVNTLSDRPLPVTRERLTDYADLVRFARQAGLVGDDLAERLRVLADQRPAEAEAARQHAVALREALFRLFAALAAGDEPPASDLAHLNRELTAAMTQLRLAPRAEPVRLHPGVEAGPGEHVVWAWQNPDGRLDAPLWPIARQAAELLVGPEHGRVRECAADDCRWLFLDTSKNHSRRWCDMKVCGNRAKVRTFYQRRRAGAPT